MARIVPGGESECGFPGIPLNGSLIGSGMLYNPHDEVSYVCQNGFVKFGVDKRRCGTNGRWSNSEPECKRNIALRKMATQSRSVVNYEAKMAIDGDPETCSVSDGKQKWWQVELHQSYRIQSVALIIAPGPSHNFSIFIIEILKGNKAKYKLCSKFEGQIKTKKIVLLCNNGNGVEGKFVYVRDEKQEQKYFGLCEVEVFEYKDSTQCGDPEQPVSSIVNRYNTNEIVYSCVKGYRLQGKASRFCDTKTGRWIGHAPLCMEVQCNHPNSVKDGFIEVSNFKGKYVYGSIATYHCNLGFILWGNTSRVCEDTGNWSGDSPTCKPITCGQPPEFPNAQFTLLNGSSTWQSISLYVCKPGFKMILSSRENLSLQISSLCLESGIWEPIMFSCIFDPLSPLSYSHERSNTPWSLFGGGLRSEDGSLNIGTLSIIVILFVLIFLVIIVVIIFFTHKRSEEDSNEKKISRSSTDRLIVTKDQLDGNQHSILSNQRVPYDESSSKNSLRNKCIPGNSTHCKFTHSSVSNVTPQSGLLSLEPLYSDSSNSDCSGCRSAGDGGSECNYSTVADRKFINVNEGSCHYSRVSKPEDSHYSSFRKNSTKDNAMESSRSQEYASFGIDTLECQEQVYETLRKQCSDYDTSHFSNSSETSNSFLSKSSHADSGVYQTDAYSLYATVDPKKKRKNRCINGSPSPEALSPSFALLDSFNTSFGNIGNSDRSSKSRLLSKLKSEDV